MSSKNLLRAWVLIACLATGGVLAASDAPTTKPAWPACCGDACKKMGSGCCKTDDKGKTTCGMGGSCCIKTDDKK